MAGIETLHHMCIDCVKFQTLCYTYKKLDMAGIETLHHMCIDCVKLQTLCYTYKKFFLGFAIITMSSRKKYQEYFLIFNIYASSCDILIIIYRFLLF